MTTDAQQKLNENSLTVLDILAKNRNALFVQTSGDTAQPFVTLTMPSADFNIISEILLKLLK